MSEKKVQFKTAKLGAEHNKKLSEKMARRRFYERQLLDIPAKAVSGVSIVPEGPAVRI